MSLRERSIEIARRLLPAKIGAWVLRTQRRLRLQLPPVGTVRFGSFRRLTPISPVFGLDRGLPIERYYIDEFLRRHSLDIRGRALEVGDDRYLRRFGGNRVARIDVLSVTEGPGVTIVADLSSGDVLPSDTFDCIIVTQTIQMIYDMRSALRCLHRILKPGGVLLLTTHGIGRIGRHPGRDDWSEYWHITAAAAKRLFDETFPAADVEVEHKGSALTAICALHGLSSKELTKKELDYVDRDFQVIVTVRAKKR